MALIAIGATHDPYLRRFRKCTTLGRRVTKPGKLYAWVLANPQASVSFRDLERLLRAFGFTHTRTVGSHRQYVHPAVPRAFPVQPEGKDAKRYQVRQLLELVKAYDLHIDA